MTCSASGRRRTGVSTVRLLRWSTARRCGCIGGCTRAARLAGRLGQMHRLGVIALLDEIEPSARRIGAVNTITIDSAGRLRGDNTDGFGFIENLRQGAPEWRAQGCVAAILGAGGAARGVAAALLASGAAEIRLINRTTARAEAVSAVLPAGGRLLLCDDFLSSSAPHRLDRKAKRFLAEFQRGWHVRSLITTAQAQTYAANAGLRLIDDRDLTPYLALRRPWDRFIAVCVSLGRGLPLRAPWWLNWIGGHAAQTCLISGFVDYRFVVFEKF